MADHLEGMLGTSMDKVRDLVDINTIVGEPIVAGGVTIVPISQVGIGFASGGSDIPSSIPKNLFGGGAGVGVSIKPKAFIVIKPDGDIKLLELGTKESMLIDGIVTGVPELITKLKNAFTKDKDKDDAVTEDTEGFVF